MKAEFFPLFIDSVEEEGRRVMRLIAADSEGKKRVFFDRNFFWYFYVVFEKRQIKSALKTLYSDEKIKKFIIKCGEEKKKFLGEEVYAVKITLGSPNFLNDVKDEVKKIKGYIRKLERDISFTTRYLIDKKISFYNNFLIEYGGDNLLEITPVKTKKYSPKVIAFDIEVENFAGSPSSLEDRISIISFYGKNIKKVFSLKKAKNAVFAKDEKELLEKFVLFIKEEKPDILLSYNGDRFDFPYLKKRAEINKVKIDIGLDSTGLYSTIKKNFASVKIKGIEHIDMYSFIQKSVSEQLKTETLKLNDVSLELLGRGKVQIDWKVFEKDWRESRNLEKYMEYCLVDSELVYLLFEKLKDMIFELADLINRDLFSITRAGYSYYVESFLLNNLDDFNEIAPNRPDYKEIIGRRTNTYSGGFVYKPEPGIYENISVADFKSLYPSIAIAYNISPDTLIVKGKTIKFNQKVRGFIPVLIKKLVDDRRAIKEKMKKSYGEERIILDARQTVIKRTANSIYGYLGFPGSRWYSIESAKEITRIGREHIMSTIESAKKEGLFVIYGDTDSIMISAPKKYVLDFVRKINKKLPEAMELEIEGFYPRGIFVSKRDELKGGAKKKYALIDENKKIIIKGFEAIRRDSCGIARETQEKVLSALLLDNSPKKAAKIIEDVSLKLEKHEIPVSETAIYTQLKKEISEYKIISPHVSAVKKAEKEGYSFSVGSLVEYVVCEGKGKISERAFILADVTQKGKKYDSQYYLKNQILPSVKNILEAAKIEDNKQTKLNF